MNTGDAVFLLQSSANNSAEIFKMSVTGNFKNNPLMATQSKEEKFGDGQPMAQSFYHG